jgi:hypothetical protein
MADLISRNLSESFELFITCSGEEENPNKKRKSTGINTLYFIVS